MLPVLTAHCRLFLCFSLLQYRNLIPVFSSQNYLRYELKDDRIQLAYAKVLKDIYGNVFILIIFQVWLTNIADMYSKNK